jgi:hypothetical protein
MIRGTIIIIITNWILATLSLICFAIFILQKVVPHPPRPPTPGPPPRPGPLGPPRPPVPTPPPSPRRNRPKLVKLPVILLLYSLGLFFLVGYIMAICFYISYLPLNLYLFI